MHYSTEALLPKILHGNSYDNENGFTASRTTIGVGHPAVKHVKWSRRSRHGEKRGRGNMGKLKPWRRSLNNRNLLSPLSMGSLPKWVLKWIRSLWSSFGSLVGSSILSHNQTEKGTRKLPFGNCRRPLRSSPLGDPIDKPLRFVFVILWKIVDQSAWVKSHESDSPRKTNV